MAKNNSNPFQNVLVLFATATFLLSAAGLMKSFPVLIFTGLAPLFAISDSAKDKSTPWNHIELILLALTISLFCTSFFDTQKIMFVLAEAIMLALAFAGYAFSYQSLGTRLGKFTIIFFWLALEYLMLKLPWRNDFFFLADTFQLQASWWKWNANLGYLASSLWVLIVNLIIYIALFKNSTINWLMVLFAFLLVTVPIVYSVYYIEIPGVNREQMIALYSNSSTNTTFSENYTNRAELVSRSAAWVSVLIILLALVKNKIKKK